MLEDDGVTLLDLVTVLDGETEDDTLNDNVAETDGAGAALGIPLDVTVPVADGVTDTLGDVLGLAKHTNAPSGVPTYTLPSDPMLTLHCTPPLALTAVCHDSAPVVVFTAYSSPNVSPPYPILPPSTDTDVAKPAPPTEANCHCSPPLTASRASPYTLPSMEGNSTNPLAVTVAMPLTTSPARKTHNCPPEEAESA